MKTKLSKLSFLIVAILWGSSFSFQNILLEKVDPFVFNFWNFFSAFCIFLLISLVKKVDLFYRWKEGLLLGLFLSGLETFQMYGLKFSTAANTSFISNIGMVLVPVFGFIIFKHKLKNINIIILLISVIGMYFLAGGVEGFRFGDVLLILSAIFMGLYFLYSEIYEKEKSASAIRVLCQTFFVVSIVSLIMAYVKGLHLYVDIKNINTLAIQTLFFTLIPYSLVQWASKYSDDMSIATYDGITEPLVGGLVAWFIFKEVATKENIIGGFIMLSAFIAYVFLRKKSFKKY